MIPVRLLARGKRKTQTLSFDVLVAVVVFLAAVALMLYMLSGGRGSRESLETMVREGETISSQLISPGEQPGSSTAVVVRNQLDRERLAVLAALSYDELKSLLGVEGDFCIHFEDSQGNLFDIDSAPAVTKYSIGSPNINFTILEDGQECSIACSSVRCSPVSCNYTTTC